MIILREKKQEENNLKLEENNHQLDEMSIRRLCSPKNNLPFKITIQTPDKFHQDHAHIKDLKTGKIDLGSFLISNTPPKTSKDILDSPEHKGITDEMREIIFKWSKLQHWAYPVTNWEALKIECAINRNS